MHLTPSFSRRLLTGLAGLSLTISGFGATAGAAPLTHHPTDDPGSRTSAAGGPSAKDTSEGFAEVEQQIQSTGSTDYWVHFEQRPDLSQFSTISDWDARGQAVYDALMQAAESSQADYRAQLEASGTAYQDFYITNAIKVTGGDATSLAAAVNDPEVAGVYPTFEVTPPEVEQTPQAELVPAPNAVEWGIADINADDIWADTGITGQGIVLASIDTGVMWNHPALIGNYRGNDGAGTINHNYNWFNAGHGNADFPNDTNGHGTHVTGTMVGDDGGTNQIGVAPGATWIAANGCCPTDAALVASGEWMLAPTDLQGQNPDPARRPHVINNSWGSNMPSNSPFMEEISEAWAAAGQFGVFSNGNSGPQCQTSGSPGSRIINYSVGNYNSSHTISGTSARGAGQDGVIKPNISAPGSAVRSAWPDGGYNTISGTSMASPHVAGAVGLLWASQPLLIGDIEGTRELLNSTAIDTSNLQCGGTAENNNVFGEGRLDVQALIDAAPGQLPGTVSGTVTDADNGSVINGALLAFDGPMEQTATSDADGTYEVLLAVGDYAVQVSRFGYADANTTLTVTEGGEHTLDFALHSLPSETVTGVVTDGSGLGGPLAATISVDGLDIETATDPTTGAYSLSLPVGTYTLTAQAQMPGYLPASAVVELSAPAVQATVDFALQVDVLACSVPGYVSELTLGEPETFDDSTVPVGWSVTDDEGNGQVWRFDDPGDRGNITGGEGGFAIVDNDFYGNGQVQRTGLVAPPQDFSADGLPVVRFAQDFRVFSDGTEQYGSVEVSTDGGATWTTEWSQVAQARGPSTLTVGLPSAAAATDVLVRFYDVDEGWSWWWQVDDVSFGTQTCTPPGPSDLQIEPEQIDTTVLAGDAATVNLTLTNNGDAPIDVELREVMGGFTPAQGSAMTSDAAAIDTTSATHTPLVQLEVPTSVAAFGSVAPHAEGDVSSSAPDGTHPHAEWEDLPSLPTSVMDGRMAVLDGVTYHLGGTSGTDSRASVYRLVDDAWESVAPLPEARHGVHAAVIDGTLIVNGGWQQSGPPSNVTYAYDPDANVWSTLASSPEGVSNGGVAVLDGQMFVVGGCTSSDCSPMSNSVQVYDLASDTWTMAPAYPQSQAFPACGAIVDSIYCSGGNTGSTVLAAGYSYTPGSGAWEPIADSPRPHWGSSYVAAGGELLVTSGVQGSAVTNAGFSYHPATDAWTDLPNNNHPVYRGAATCGMAKAGGSSGGFAPITGAELLPGYDDCEAVVDVPWLSADPMSVTVSPGASIDVEVTTDSSVVADLGTYTAGLRVRSAALPTPVLVPVSMTVRAPVPATIEVDPATIEVTLEEGESLTEQVSITNTGELDLTWAIATSDDACIEADADWLTLDPVSGTTTSGDTDTVEATLAGTEAGEHTTYLCITSNDPDSPTTLIPVTLTVTEVIEPEPDLVVERWYGANRYETAVAISSHIEPGIDVVYLATGTDYADALAGAALAGSVDAPVLLTRPDHLVHATAAELERLQPERVVLFGGTQAIHEHVAVQVAEATGVPVERLAGANRYETAAAIAGEFGPVDVVYIATGLDYPDALAGAARAGAVNGPVLLTRGDLLPQATIAELERLEPTSIRLLGGTTAISEEIETALAAYGDVTRIAGEDRYETAVALSADFDESPVIYLASGQNWPDALTGAARAGSDEAPVLLSRVETTTLATWAELERLDPAKIVILGGTSVISAEVEAHLHELP